MIGVFLTLSSQNLVRLGLLCQSTLWTAHIYLSSPHIKTPISTVEERKSPLEMVGWKRESPSETVGWKRDKQHACCIPRKVRMLKLVGGHKEEAVAGVNLFLLLAPFAPIFILSVQGQLRAGSHFTQRRNILVSLRITCSSITWYHNAHSSLAPAGIPGGQKVVGLMLCVGQLRLTSNRGLFAYQVDVFLKFM